MPFFGSIAPNFRQSGQCLSNHELYEHFSLASDIVYDE